MDPLVSDYFLTFSQVAIGFVAFSTIAVVLREMIASSFDAYQTLLLRFVIESGLAATIYALAPVLLVVAGLTAPLLWRVCSAALDTRQSIGAARPAIASIAGASA